MLARSSLNCTCISVIKAAAIAALIPSMGSAAVCSEATTASDVFRSLFHAHGQVSYSAPQLDSLLFPVPSRLVDADRGATVRDSALGRLSSVVRGLVTTEMHKESKPVCAAVDPDAPLREKPLTIVLLPEFLSEFASSQPLRSIVERPNSAASLRWQQLVAAHSDASDRYDWVYDLRALDNVQVPITETVRVGSLDDEQGRPLVTVIFLKPRLGSLESMGSVEETNAYFMPRLSRAFRILGVPDEFYFLGFSRGAALSLDMMTSARKHSDVYSWGSNAKGVVSLAGVNFGSLTADAVTTPGNPEYAFFSELDKLGKRLHGVSSDDSAADKARKAVENIAFWKDAVVSFARALAQWPIRKEFLQEKHLWQSLPGTAVFDFLRKVGFEFFDVASPVDEFFKNSQRFKVMTAKFGRAVEDLTTRGRLNWWRSNVIPSDVDLFAVGASFGDPTNEKTGFVPLARNPLAYNWRALDTVFLRFGFYSMLNNTGATANDGLVSLDRVFFWPNLMKSLNPQQPEVRVHNLGVAGVDHLGTTTDSATFAENTGGRSPFPHEILFRSIASYVALSASKR